MAESEILRENLDNSISKQDLARENFQFIIEGIIREEENKDYLITPDGRKFKVKRTGSNLSKNLLGFWQVEPSVDNLDLVNNSIIEKKIIKKIS